MTKVLVFVSYYTPGFKGGGPIKSIQNLVEQLGDEFEFWVVTGDRDLGDSQPYIGLTLNEWTKVGNANVLYLPQANRNIMAIRKLINSVDYDVLYLNSFFSPVFSIFPLIAIKLGLCNKCRIILAPRGEFSEGALRLKRFKKWLYLLLSKISGVYECVAFQASSEFESMDIERSLRFRDYIPDTVIAKDLATPPRGGYTENDCEHNPSIFRVIFLSRISPIKNLDLALKIISRVELPVAFDIYGPIEDPSYWTTCAELMKDFPKHVEARYCGIVRPDDVRNVFAKYDLFFFPTRGENYGHVIAEALAVGTPVLISDTTPWRDLAASRLGWEWPLEEESLFLNTLNSCAQLSVSERNIQRSEVLKNCHTLIHNTEDVEANRLLFSNRNDIC